MCMTQKVLEKLDNLERDLQILKVELLLKAKVKNQVSGPYKEKDIVKEVRKTRKQLWNGTYKKHL